MRVASQWAAFATSAFLFFGFHEPAQAAIAEAVAMENVVQDLKTGLSELINQAETAYSRQAFDTRMHALIILQMLDTVANDVIGKTFKELTATQKKFFQDTDNLLTKAQSGAKSVLADAQAITTTAEETVSRFPLADKSALLKAYYPTYVLMEKTNQEFKVRLNGTRLGTGTPSLSFGKNVCKVFSQTDRDIEFTCPRAAIGVTPKVVSLTGDLKLINPKTFWDYITFKESERKLKIGIVGVPEVLGTYTVRVVTEQAVEERQDRKFEFGHTNPHCSGNADLNWPVNASDGWKIIESSVKVVPISVSSGCSGPQAESVASTGFRVTGKAVNSGNCVRVMGQTVSKDGRGWVKGYATWTEARTTKKDGNVDVGAGSLLWGRDLTLTLPENTKGWVISVIRVDGTQKTHTASKPEDRYEVVYDDVSRTLVIKPRPLDDALKV